MLEKQDALDFKTQNINNHYTSTNLRTSQMRFQS
jgi:hypothetical protein